MRTIYDGIDLMPLLTHYFDWESVYDPSGVDYLYSKVSMAIRGVVNGQASVNGLSGGQRDFINYAFAPGFGITLGGRAFPFRTDAPKIVPIGGVGGLNVPPDAGIDNATLSSLRNIVRNPTAGLGGGINPTDISHQAIRFRLSIPQRQLYIFWGAGYEIFGGDGLPPGGGEAPPTFARLFLQSPGVDPLTGQARRVDCKNGPFPRILSVTQAEGDANTLIVDWAVETYVNEGVDNEVDFAGMGLLSNRFAQVHEVLDGWTTVTTTGLAIFRTDRVFTLPVSPDSSRPFIFMPILNGWKRDVLYVRGREDVTGVEYSYRDTQQPVNFVAGPFAKAQSIHALHRQAISTNVDLAGSALQAYERTLNILVNRKFAKDEAPDPARLLGAKFRRWKPGMNPPPNPVAPPIPKKP